MYRKAQCFCEKLQMEAAVTILKQAIAIDPENKDVNVLLKDYLNEQDEDTKLPLDHPERKKFDCMLTWMLAGGSEFDKLKIRYYSQNHRGVHASRDIKKNETILFVPKSRIITLEMAYASPIGKKMYEKGLR